MSVGRPFVEVAAAAALGYCDEYGTDTYIRVPEINRTGNGYVADR